MIGGYAGGKPESEKLMRISRHQWAMQMAELTAKRSTCCRRSVGCVMLNRRGHVIATGYNGVAAGLPHCNEPSGESFEHGCTGEYAVPVYPNSCEGATSPSGTNLDACQAIHAEQNALLQCRDVYQIHIAYVTVSPCITCTKLLLNTSCEVIAFKSKYPHKDAQKLWESSGRKWVEVGLD